MTGTAYPGDAVTGIPTYTATQGRTALAAAMGGATASRPLGGTSGVRSGTPTNIATATSTTWTVTPFNGYIDLEPLATNGGYFFSFQANETGSVTAAAGSARVDLLYVQINDSNTGDGSGLSPRATVGYQAGVAGAGVPALSASRAFVLAQINVPASGGGSPTVTFVAPVTFAAGAVPRVSSAAQRNATFPSPNPGDQCVRLDLGWTEQYFTSGSGFVGTSGWFPIDGKLPYMSRSRAAAYTFPVGDTPFQFDTVLVGDPSGSITYSGNDFIVSQTGLYEYEAVVEAVAGTTFVALSAIIPGVAALQRVTAGQASGAPTSLRVHGFTVISATQQLDFRTQAGSVQNGNVTDGGYPATFAMLRYIGPA